MAESERVRRGAFIDSSLVGSLSGQVDKHTCMLLRHVQNLAKVVGNVNRHMDCITIWAGRGAVAYTCSHT